MACCGSNIPRALAAWPMSTVPSGRTETAEGMVGRPSIGMVSTLLRRQTQTLNSVVPKSIPIGFGMSLSGVNSYVSFDMPNFS